MTCIRPNLGEKQQNEAERDNQRLTPSNPTSPQWTLFKSQIIQFQVLRDRTVLLVLLPYHQLLSPHHHSQLESAPPTPSLPLLIPTNNNNISINTNPHFVTFILTLLPSNMQLVTLAELSQNSARIYSFKPSARASLEKSNSVSIQHGQKKSL